jgi:replicative DNA helicase
MVTPSSAQYLVGDSLFGTWRESVLTGEAPVTYPHGLPVPELSPGSVTLVGGAPGAGKTALVMQSVVEALRHTATLRALVANCEMSPAALLDRLLARLSGIPAEAIRHRRFAAEHADRLDTGLATVETFANRLAILRPPFDLENVAFAADAHQAELIVIDYIQRFSCPGGDCDARARLNRTMDYLRKFADAGCAVVVLSAIGRSKDDRGRATYSGAGLASFRESSELEFGADDAFVLAPVDDGNPDVVRLAHLKCRHGAQRTVDLHFDRAHQSFTLLGEATPTRARGKRGRTPKIVEPCPDFAPERLAALWGTTLPAAADDDGGD